MDAVRLFLQQLPALLGVLIGALATFGATSVSDRTRWRRLQSVRWDEKRVNAYAEYAHAVKQVLAVALRLAALREANPASGKPPSKDELAELGKVEEERTTKWEAVLLLGSSEVVIAARKWHTSVFALQRLAYGKLSNFSFAEAIKEVSTARRNFYEVVKRDIGIEIGTSSEAYEWQLSKITDSGFDDAGDPHWYRSQRITEDLCHAA